MTRVRLQAFKIEDHINIIKFVPNSFNAKCNRFLFKL